MMNLVFTPPIQRDPYDVSFFTDPHGNAILNVRVTNYVTDLSVPFLKHQRTVALAVRPNGESTVCTLATDLNHSNGNGHTPTLYGLDEEIVSGAADIARVGWRTLHDLSNSGETNGRRPLNGHFNHGYYRQTIPNPDPLPWRRCRLDPDSVDAYRAWQTSTRYGTKDIDFVCDRLWEQADTLIDPRREVRAEFADIGPFHVDVPELRFPIVPAGNEGQYEPMGRKL